MIIKTCELEGRALDYAVAQIDPFCDGLEWRRVAGGLAWAGFGRVNGEMTPCAYLSHASNLSERMRMLRDVVEPYSPSTYWSQGGPLIERFGLTLSRFDDGLIEAYRNDESTPQSSNSYLIAACRAIVASELGDEVDVPDEIAKSGD